MAARRTATSPIVHPQERTKQVLTNGGDPSTNGYLDVGFVDPPEYGSNAYLHLLMRPAKIKPVKQRLILGIPMTGLIRSEWAMARYGQIVPTNWSLVECRQYLNQLTPLGFNVADARNVIVHWALHYNFEWLLFVDSDVVLPPNNFMVMNDYIRKGDIPVVFGLYFTKSDPPEPLVYRGRGNSYFSHFKLGEKFWVDGIGMGNTLINVNLLRLMAADAPEYVAGGAIRVKQVFDTPQMIWTDPETSMMRTFGGTEDIAWCDRVMKGDYLTKAGFPKIAKRRYPFLCDSSITSMHITEEGIMYPLRWAW